METLISQTADKKTQEIRSTIGNPEAEIRDVLNEIKSAMRAADVEKLMSFYAPDIVAFDVMAPLQFKGKEAYKQSWIDAFEGMDPESKDSKQDFQEIHITATSELAFVHLIRHDVGVPLHGKKLDMWMRATHCFKRIGGKWLITHEQFSLPVDFKTSKAVFDAVPELSTDFH